MPVFHSNAQQTTVSNIVLLNLQEAIEGLCSTGHREERFEEFERQLHGLFAQAEREVLGQELEQLDIDLPYVIVDGVKHWQVLRSACTYTSAAGPIRAQRTLYRSRRGAKAIVPMELRAGIVGGHWSALAAKQAAWTVAHLSPKEGEALFQQLGNMQPSKSSLDRLPKLLSANWEARREVFEQSLRSDESVPEDAVTLSVSLDGVLVPMKDAERQTKRALAKAEGKRQCGPAGYQEASCGTVSYYDAQGERLSTIRLARMPESKKVTLKSQLSAEIASALSQRPELTVVKLADGAVDNWTFLGDELPEGVELIDFFHAAQHLKEAFDAAYGENSAKASAQFQKYRTILRDEHNGVEKVIRTLVYLSDKYPRRKKLKTERTYFRKRRARMQYATAKEQLLPIGSGVVEAACKTLASERMKRSGMRWRHEGGQAILTFRSLIQSGRFERAWELFAGTYRQEVSLPENVVPIKRQMAA